MQARRLGLGVSKPQRKFAYRQSVQCRWLIMEVRTVSWPEDRPQQARELDDGHGPGGRG